MDLLTTRQAADELGLSLRAVQYLCVAGKLPAQRVGRDYLIERKDLELVREGRRPGPGRPKSQTEQPEGKPRRKRK